MEAGPTLESLGLPAWTTLDQAYSLYREETLKGVARWEFGRASGVGEAALVLWAERLGTAPGLQLFKQEPTSWKSIKRHGLNARDEVSFTQELGREAGAEPRVIYETMVVDVRGQQTHLQFILEGRPSLQRVSVQLRERGILRGVADFWAHGSLLEHYAWDAEGRVVEIVGVITEYGDTSFDRELLTYAADGSVKRITEPRINKKNGASRLAELARKPLPNHAIRPTSLFSEFHEPTKPEAAELLRLQQSVLDRLVAGVVQWEARNSKTADLARIMLLHDWPSNPPLPPGIVARSSDEPTSADGHPLDWLDGDDTLLDAAPPEFSAQALQTDCETLNQWWDDNESDPFDFLIDLARRSHQDIADSTGRSVWVIPVDRDGQRNARTIARLLPADLIDETGLSKLIQP